MGTGNRPQDGFRYQPEDVAAIAERFTIEPVAPSAIRDRIDDGYAVATTDIPEHLDRQLASDADGSIALYRLVQLFGTPNVPGLEAGADQPTRERRTWQYLFGVEHRPEDGADPREYLLSVYDYRTDLSVGVSEWSRHEAGAAVPEPSGEPLSGGMPEEAVLDQLVKLVLSTVEYAVEATYEDLRV